LSFFELLFKILQDKKEETAMKKILFTLTCALLSFNLFAKPIPTFEANYETTPIPAGTESSDDAEVWLHPTDSSKSLVLGVSKNKMKHGGKPGLAVYDLKGKEIQYLLHDRLNNVDLRYNFSMGNQKVDVAFASNRDKRAISVFAIHGGNNPVTLLADLVAKDSKGETVDEEPYGLCMYHDLAKDGFFAYLPMKSGKVFAYEVKYENGRLIARFKQLIDLRDSIDRKTDNHLANITAKDVILEESRTDNELIEKITEEMDDRFQLEGCVADDEYGILYIGMEQLGVFSLDLKNKQAKPNLILKTTKSKEEPTASDFDNGKPRFTNDIEGITLYATGKGHGALLVSVQGINEYALIDRQSHKYLGSFEVNFGKDAVTETDGIAAISTTLNADYPAGIMVLHDHHNTENGKIVNANYKYLSLEKVMQTFGIDTSGQWNPRQLKSLR
jgi:3-phytase